VFVKEMAMTMGLQESGDKTVQVWLARFSAGEFAMSHNDND